SRHPGGSGAKVADPARRPAVATRPRVGRTLGAAVGRGRDARRAAPMDAAAVGPRSSCPTTRCTGCGFGFGRERTAWTAAFQGVRCPGQTGKRPRSIVDNYSYGRPILAGLQEMPPSMLLYTLP